MKFKLAGRILPMMLVSLLAAALAGCGTADKSTTAATDTTTESSDKRETTISARAGEDIQVTEEPIEDEKTAEDDSQQSEADNEGNSAEVSGEDSAENKAESDAQKDSAEAESSDDASAAEDKSEWKFYNVKDGKVSLKGELSEIPKSEIQNAINELYAIKGYQFKEEPYKSKYPNGKIADMNDIQFTQAEQSILTNLTELKNN